MEYLLDTHTVIWAFTDDVKLSERVSAIIGNTSNTLYISIVSLWEIAVKVNAGKANFAGNVSSFLEEIHENEIKIIGVETPHVKCVESLPLIHRDPFDRMIIATAKTNNLIILTADENIYKYEVSSVWD